MAVKEFKVTIAPGIQKAQNRVNAAEDFRVTATWLENLICKQLHEGMVLVEASN